MNEPIQKLSNIWANRRFEKDGEIYYQFSERALEVFSKELVKECTKVIENWKGEPFPFDEDLAVSLLKEYFEIG